LNEKLPKLRKETLPKVLYKIFKRRIVENSKTLIDGLNTL